MKEHNYTVEINWTGNSGQGTRGYRDYSRNHEIAAPGKPIVPGSSDPAFRGDVTRYNPEEFLVASLSTCHMLSYLHLCAVNGVVVEAYTDKPTGVMKEKTGGSGVFTDVTLHPEVTISAESDERKAMALHDDAHHLCFIANSVNFPVKHQARVIKTAG